MNGDVALATGENSGELRKQKRQQACSEIRHSGEGSSSLKVQFRLRRFVPHESGWHWRLSTDYHLFRKISLLEFQFVKEISSAFVAGLRFDLPLFENIVP